MSRSKQLFLFSFLWFGIGCGSSQTGAERIPVDEAANKFFEKTFQRSVSRSPMLQTYLGIKDDYGKWDDISDERAQEDYELAKQDLAQVTRFASNKYTRQRQTDISLRLARHKLETEIEAHQWRFHNYPVHQMYGMHTRVPAFLSNKHNIDNKADAEAYVERLRGVKALFAQLETNLKARESKGILPPKFVFPRVLDAANNVISGRPFKGKKDSTILADFRKKVNALEIDKATRNELLSKAEKALKTSVKPAYESLIKLLRQQRKAAGTDDGVWRLPKGKDFYNFALRRTTTTQLTADEVHQTGLREVSRIHGEMREIMKAVKFKGNLASFFRFMLTSKKFYYASNKKGRNQYLTDARKIIKSMESRLGELFVTLPKAKLVVKAVEPFREKTAGKAFYDGPAPDGSRPGMYYANLYDMADMPTYQMEALAYHEAVPGHHMQIAIAQELEGLPKFRRFGGYTAFSEGWGLYSEKIPKEMGLYSDPYSDFGRLAMELWRACRLVVDTGIHTKKWTREKAIAYLEENTPNAEGDIVKAIERYIVMPSQATAYKVGMLRIEALRRNCLLYTSPSPRD